MSAEVIIHRNALRLLCHIFIAIVPLKKFTVSPGGIYGCVIPGIGEMGKIECLSVDTVELGSITKRVNELCDCNVDLLEDYKREGYYKVDKMQVGFFRFKRRNDELFAKLIEVDTKRIGLVLTPQGSLF